MTLAIFQGIHLSFILDWIFIIGIVILTIPINIISPFERLFNIEDETISYPYKEKETFTIFGLAVSVIGIPAVIMTLYHLFKKELKYSFHQTIMGYCVSVTLALFVTSIIKVSVGRYRPDFISRCRVNLTKVEETYIKYNISKEINYGPRNLYDTSICTNKDKSLIDEGRKSFPSGHTSFAFSSLTYTSLFLAGKLHLCDGNFVFWKLFIVILPNLFALYIALTRVSDYRHHWQDVLVGAIIGIIFSLISYFYYFPYLNSEEPYKPLPGRLKKYNLFHEQSAKTLPVFRDRDSEVTNINE
ncbi:PAP2-domain-containing protein [Neocallimastix californiae]|jgi:diacylglycerol diphosphate phosphatase/phosphatidate phosphatase|uniref:PAP2-domain-containing protein n=1 Tax=Neocallimastix californiae TaxID=1754190 RepID=A0A1Y2DZK3_9FUNG|nr:PAP2-domain-containing protein [Neocallimastix californiae]|eukprot:ORY64677.1 PAP2-domain-containing protein [Neocallimastix californiae]